MKEISNELYSKLEVLGIVGDDISSREYNIGSSNYADHIIQPWSIWIDWNLNPWDADIIKRVLRTKLNSSRKEDYCKIIHICEERIRQIETEIRTQVADIDFENVD